METSLKSAINNTGSLSDTQRKLLKRLASENPKLVVATADHTVNTTNTLANHESLYFDVKAGRKYVVEAELLTLANGTDGIKVAFNTTTDATSARIRWTYSVTAAADTAEFQTDITSPSPTGRNAAVTGIRGNGVIHAGADGRITLQSALHTDNNAASVIYKFSYIKIYEFE